MEKTHRDNFEKKKKLNFAKCDYSAQIIRNKTGGVGVGQKIKYSAAARMLRKKTILLQILLTDITLLSQC